MVFEAPDDGTAALPTLRNIIVNDRKFATYKLGLLRVFLRIAAEASGMVRRAEDGAVRIPSGLVCLYWLRNYWAAIVEGMPQMPGQPTAIAENIRILDSQISPYDLRIGSNFSHDPQFLHDTLKKTRKSITGQGPVKHTTFAGTDQPIFLHENAHLWNSVEDLSVDTSDGLELSPEYLKSFGWISVPGHIFDAMVRHWVWI
ncbi:MAG: hypothetical protein ABEN55_08970, partial [Bradymonadaceae bacterium]